MSLHEQTRMALGAYALGTLEPTEQHAIEAHLASCPDCLAELDELLAVVPALSAVSTADLEAPEPSPDLFDRIARAAQPARGLRSRRRLLAVAASVAVLAAGGTAIGLALGSSTSAPTSFSASAAGIRLTGAASSTSTGTRLALTVHGLPTRERCHLVATSADGSTHDAGTWDASYEGRAQVVEHTDVTLGKLRRLTLYGSSGNELLSVAV